MPWFVSDYASWMPISAETLISKTALLTNTRSSEILTIWDYMDLSYQTTPVNTSVQPEYTNSARSPLQHYLTTVQTIMKNKKGRLFGNSCLQKSDAQVVLCSIYHPDPGVTLWTGTSIIYAIINLLS